jgi:arylsulfatase A-like enzyme
VKLLTAFLCALCVLCGSSSSATAADKPNFIVILADDLGYGDLACYGGGGAATPHLDRMAREGARFTSFYVAPVCSPTRASLMTGSIAQRVGIGGVLFPRNNHGLNPDEKTLPELVKEQGYATAINGKWHLGGGASAGPLRGEKGSCFEGGVRVPCIMRWPGKIPTGHVTDEPAAIMDLLPTLTKLASGSVPSDRVIDGKDIWPLLAGKPDAKSPHDGIFYLRGRSVNGVRSGDWKYLTVSAKEMTEAAGVAE